MCGRPSNNRQRQFFSRKGAKTQRKPKTRGSALRLLREKSSSEIKITKSRMIIGSPAERPMVFALCFLDRQFVDARKPSTHQSVIVKLPVFVSIRAKPVLRVVMPLVCKAHRNAIALMDPQLFDESIIQLPRPLPFKQRNDLPAAIGKLGAVSPARIRRIGERHFSASRKFHASSASRTFRIALSRVKGGNGGRGTATSTSLPSITGVELINTSLYRSDRALNRSYSSRTISVKNQCRRSASSIQTSIKLVVATSAYSSQIECVSRNAWMNLRLSPRSSASISSAGTNS